jgi:hypothetical protein
MSYEGYTQILCKKGHYHTIDCYDDINSFRCPDCHTKPAWWNSVDLTNGSFDVDENGRQVQIDGAINSFKVKQKAVIEKCPTCHTKVVKVKQTYEVPKKHGHKFK